MQRKTATLVCDIPDRPGDSLFRLSEPIAFAVEGTGQELKTNFVAIIQNNYGYYYALVPSDKRGNIIQYDPILKTESHNRFVLLSQLDFELQLDTSDDVMVCSHCSTRNISGNSTCRQCGAPLT